MLLPLPKNKAFEKRAGSLLGLTIPLELFEFLVHMHLALSSISLKLEKFNAHRKN